MPRELMTVQRGGPEAVAEHAEGSGCWAPSFLGVEPLLCAVLQPFLLVWGRPTCYRYSPCFFLPGCNSYLISR
uniref:Uncharacterized protein n=1 Tax=Zea mays TaxID=4577 RepID=C4J7S1_MAIZE|nr:unknown [Zea mays]